jgi:hypothetical protein
MSTIDAKYQIQQPLAQFFVAQMINLEWVQQGGGDHQVFGAKSDVDDGGGHELITAYAVHRPDGQWSLMIVNRDQMNGHKVGIAFNDSSRAAASFAGTVKIATFGSGQYQWHPARTRFMAHAEKSAEPTIVATTKGAADPDGPIGHSQQNAAKDTMYDLPAASVVVIRGKVGLK